MPTAFVSGASRGIGRAVSLKLASLGYDLALNYQNNHAAAQKVCTEAQKYGVKVLLLPADIADEQAVKAMFKQITATFGGIDVLVNNAGIAEQLLFQDITYEKWRRMFAVTADGAFFTIQNALPFMLKQKNGRIINISSVWGNVGASMEVAYSASKGGVNSFTKALAKELAPSNIQVNAISCGVIDTAMNHCFSPEEMNALREEIPADRLGQPEEVAKLVLQLIQAPTYLTGQILTLDGGWQ